MEQYHRKKTSHLTTSQPFFAARFLIVIDPPRRRECVETIYAGGFLPFFQLKEKVYQIFANVYIYKLYTLRLQQRICKR